MIEASAVFCDALTVTTPLEEWESLPGDMTDLLNASSMQLSYRDDGRELWETPDDTGIVRFQRHGKARVVSVHASGRALARLRSAKLFAEYLHVLASRPHKVTRIDVSADVACDAPAVLADVLDRGRSGLVSLTRKAVHREAVEFWNSLRPDGRESGTIYLNKKADVGACIYDKRLERYNKTPAEWDDLDERLRYELRVTNGLPTLGDAYCPAPLFFQHMSPSLVPRPDGVAERVHNGFGFSIERSPPPLPAARLKSRAETSADLGALCVLAARDGAGGLPFLLSLVRARYDREVARAAKSGVKGPPAPSVTNPAPSETASVVVPLRRQSEPADGPASR